MPAGEPVLGFLQAPAADFDDVRHLDPSVFPPLDGQIDLPPGRLGTFVEVAVQVHGADRDGLERLVTQRQGLIGDVQREIMLSLF